MPRPQRRAAPPGTTATASSYRARARFLAPDGSVSEVDALLLTPGVEWSDQDEAEDPAWGAARVGPYTIALRITY
jgi:hypothetical protein